MATVLLAISTFFVGLVTGVLIMGFMAGVGYNNKKEEEMKDAKRE